MDERGSVEGSEDHVHLPVDTPEERGHGEGEGTVPGPVGGGRERHGLGADLGGEDFRWVGPGCRAPGGGECSDEEV